MRSGEGKEVKKRIYLRNLSFAFDTLSDKSLCFLPLTVIPNYIYQNERSEFERV